MLPAPDALKNYLATSDTFMWVDLYTFKLIGGETFRYSGSSVPLGIPKTCWTADSGSLNYDTSGSWLFGLGPAFGRSKVKRVIGLKPTELELTVMAGIDDELGSSGITWQYAATQGLFDKCVVELDRFLAGPAGITDASLGCIVWFYGEVGDIDIGRTHINMKIQSFNAFLSMQQMPRRLYSATCTHVFGDNMCLFNRETRAADIVAQAGSTQSQIVTTLAPTPANLYIEGTLKGTSGQNNGFVRTINNYGGGIINFLPPLLYPVNAGDTFHLLPGCDHTVNTCQGTFDNLIHYGGFPYIPSPEHAV